MADFPLNLYFQDGRGVYVNLYGGSELRWKPNGVPVTLDAEDGVSGVGRDCVSRGPGVAGRICAYGCAFQAGCSSPPGFP